MNETLDTIAKRFSCRYFKADPLSDELVKTIAMAGAQAPSAKNRKPWWISVVRNKSLLKELEAEALANLHRQEDQSDYTYVLKRGGGIFYGAPCVMVVAVDPAIPNAQIDGAIVAENIVLAATSLGLGTVYCGFLRHAFRGEAGQHFSLRLEQPRGYVFCCAVVLGYPAKTRQPLAPGLDKISYCDE